jgi:hypothetical protein
MDRETEEARDGQRKTVVILSNRSREIIRLFEERWRKRQQVEPRPPQVTLDGNRVILMAVGLTIGLAAMGMAEFIQPTSPKKPAVSVAAQGPVRIVGPAFVPNINPRQH